MTCSHHVENQSLPASLNKFSSRHGGNVSDIFNVIPLKIPSNSGVVNPSSILGKAILMTLKEVVVTFSLAVRHGG